MNHLKKLVKKFKINRPLKLCADILKLPGLCLTRAYIGKISEKIILL